MSPERDSPAYPFHTDYMSGVPVVEGVRLCYMLQWCISCVQRN